MFRQSPSHQQNENKGDLKPSSKNIRRVVPSEAVAKLLIAELVKRERDYNKIEELIQKENIDLNFAFKNDGGATPLHGAVYVNKWSGPDIGFDGRLVDLLLKYGASFNFKAEETNAVSALAYLFGKWRYAFDELTCDSAQSLEKLTKEIYDTFKRHNVKFANKEEQNMLVRVFDFYYGKSYKTDENCFGYKLTRLIKNDELFKIEQVSISNSGQEFFPGAPGGPGFHSAPGGVPAEVLLSDCSKQEFKKS